MKKILIFSLNYYPRYIGGAEVAIKEITDRIDDIEFHLITLRFDTNLPKIEKVGNVTVHRIGPVRKAPSISDLSKFPLHQNKYLYQLLAWLYAEKLHRKHHFSGTWAMMAHSCAIPAGLFKRFHPHVPYVLTLQEGDPPEYIERMMRPVWSLFRYGFTSADILQPISTFLGEWGRRMGFAGSFEVIPNGVDTKRFSEFCSLDDLEKARKQLGINAGDIALITTSRLVHKNGIDDVIRAIPGMPPSVRFFVCGIGPDEAMLKELAKSSHIADRVVFVGQVGHTEMPCLLQASDIFIRPSRSEGMGNSFIEAMAAGIPVIATHEGGIPDFLFDPEKSPDKPATGIAVAKDSPAEISEAVTKLVTDIDHATMLTRNAKEFLESGIYDWNSIALRMKKIFAALS